MWYTIKAIEKIVAFYTLINLQGEADLVCEPQLNV